MEDDCTTCEGTGHVPITAATPWRAEHCPDCGATGKDGGVPPAAQE